MKRRISSVTALLLFFSAALLIPIVLSSCQLTVKTAQEIQAQKANDIRRIVNRFDPSRNTDTESSGYDEYRLQFLPELLGNGDASTEAAVVFFENGEPVIKMYDYAKIVYIPGNQWYSQGMELMTQAETDNPILTLDRFPTDPFEMLSGASTLFLNLRFALQEDPILLQQIYDNGGLQADIIRMTGYGRYQDGEPWLESFVPTSISTLQISDPAIYDGKPLGQLDAEGQLLWENLYQASPDSPILEEIQAQLGTEAELVEIFALDGLQYYAGDVFEPVSYPMDPELRQILLGRPNYHGSDSLWETIIIHDKSVTIGEHNQHELWAAVRFYPMKEAAIQLRYLYLVSGILFFVLLFLFRLLLERRLEKPMQQVIEGMENNISPIRNPYWARWGDFLKIQKGYMDIQKEVQSLRQENTRLQTALEYAENAEINRRQMVSNITHELKTPLAVIHSYCEGLQAGIAPEKQEKYLDVITEEADRMDAMVLEMLDLSRLEAGKVRLAQDSVELLGLTRSILDRLQPLLEAKELTLEYPLSFPAQLTADEARMTQVITNLASNAIKYSPQGGRIIICISQRHGYTHFSIENESPPLSQEALEKIWESFYRTEQSRTTKGTGLGLPICKAIIELHGGTCRAQNTSTGVEFSFSIP